MARARILVVEDEESIGQGLCDVLTFRGHEVSWAKDGASALQQGSASAFDLILLDVMLPELDGYSVCQKLRERNVRSGIIMLTAKGSEEDILRGFEGGADDYVTKPFSLRQLLARVEALLGRSRPSEVEEFSAGSLTVNRARASLAGPGGEIEISLKEIGVLRLLFEDPGRIIARRNLLSEVWGMQNAEGVETRTVDVHMGKLRKKLSAVSSCEIQAVRGQGYRLILERGS
jgi:two-component system response regulator RegX3